MPCCLRALIAVSFPVPDGAESTKRSPCFADGAADICSCCDTVCSVSSCMLFPPDIIGAAFREMVYEQIVFCYTNMYLVLRYGLLHSIYRSHKMSPVWYRIEQTAYLQRFMKKAS